MTPVLIHSQVMLDHLECSSETTGTVDLTQEREKNFPPSAWPELVREESLPPFLGEELA